LKSANIATDFALLIALEHVRAKKKMMHFACFAENLRLFEKVQKDIKGHRSRQALSLFSIILSFSMKMIRSIIPTSILLRKSALIQSRTSLPRFVSFASCGIQVSPTRPTPCLAAPTGRRIDRAPRRTCATIPSGRRNFQDLRCSPEARSHLAARRAVAAQLPS